MSKKGNKPIPEDLEFDREKVDKYKVFLKDTNKKVVKLEQQIRVLKKSVVSEGKKKLPLPLIYGLYYESRINTNDITKTFGIPSLPILRKIIGNYVFHYRCNHCDKVLTKEITSREEYRKMSPDFYNYLPNKCPDCTQPLCDDCYAEAYKDYADKCKAGRVKQLKAMQYNDYLQTPDSR